MKKILFATTALVATASVASADIANIKISGYGRFGLGYVEDRSENDGDDLDETVIVSRLRINIDAKAETDSGVEFAARFRLQADEDASTGEADSGSISGARFSASYGGLRVDVGNTSGVIDNSANYFGEEPGLENFAGQYDAVDYSILEFDSTGAGSNAVYARYEIGDFGVAASYDSAPSGGDGDRFDIGVDYTFGNWTAELLYGSTDNGSDDDEDITLLVVGGSIGDFNVTALIGDEDVNGEDDNGDSTGRTDEEASDVFYGLSAGYDVTSATTIVASYGGGSGDNDAESFALGFVHSLGGGVSLRGGIGSDKANDDADSVTTADFGVRFNF